MKNERFINYDIQKETVRNTRGVFIATQFKNSTKPNLIIK